ncbi:hypothetical protein HAPS_0566 [Glaesserella parasuis SH0165]|uniref:Uncharacterized protein n=2 Tax=Glaesserella parasuis TaxID=738 RepID=B8F4G8_GLAP5|nr:hypothetical protein HAPS_0566 [Glaesserella parasuis SH0165]
MFVDVDLNIVIEVWESRWIAEEKQWNLLSIKKSELMSADEGKKFWKEMINL